MGSSSLALAYVLNPIVTWLEQRGLGRTWGVSGAFVALISYNTIQIGVVAPTVESVIPSSVSPMPARW